MSKWREAALRYQAVVDRDLPRPSPPLSQGDSALPSPDLVQAAAELQAFLESEEGQDALYMLRAADESISLGMKNHGDGYGTSYVLDGYGLRQIVAAITGEAIPSPNPQPPQFTTTPAIEAILALTNPDWGAGIEASEVIGWLLDHLATIADWSHNAHFMFHPD